MMIKGQITEKSSVVGYKRALLYNENYYSVVTGMMYEEGMTIPHLKVEDVKGKPLACSCINDPRALLDPKIDWGYEEDLLGKTCVYVDSKDAIDDSQKEESILKMVLSGDLHFGNYGGLDIFMGTKIESMELFAKPKATTCSSNTLMCAQRLNQGIHDHIVPENLFKYEKKEQS